MSVIQCFVCHLPIYRMLQIPLPGEPLQAYSFRSLLPTQYPDPSPYSAIRCPHCGDFPFVAHNTGLQALTIEGELLP